MATNNSFWCRKELKTWISCALSEQKRFSSGNLTHVVFWKKGELSYKNQLKRSVLKSQFHNPRNLDEKTDFFSIYAKITSNPRRNKKWIKYAFIIGSNKIHVFFYNQRFFSSQPQRCVTFSWNQRQMLLRCCLIHISIIILR